LNKGAAKVAGVIRNGAKRKLLSPGDIDLGQTSMSRTNPWKT